MHEDLPKTEMVSKGEVSARKSVSMKQKDFYANEKTLTTVMFCNKPT